MAVNIWLLRFIPNLLWFYNLVHGDSLTSLYVKKIVELQSQCYHTCWTETHLTLSLPNKLYAKFHFSSASIFKVLQCRSKLATLLFECQTGWIQMRRRVTRLSFGSKLFAYGTLVVNGGLRVNPLLIEHILEQLVFFFYRCFQNYSIIQFWFSKKF